MNQKKKITRRVEKNVLNKICNKCKQKLIEAAQQHGKNITKVNFKELYCDKCYKIVAGEGKKLE